MILCSNSCKTIEGKAGASGIVLSAVADETTVKYANCLSQNHTLFGYFLAAKSILKRKEDSKFKISFKLDAFERKSIKLYPKNSLIFTP